MTILTFLKDLIPSFGRKDVREKLRLISSKTSDILSPSLESFAADLNERQLKSKYGKDFMDALYKFLPLHLRNDKTPFVKSMTIAIEHALKTNELLQDYVGKQMGEGIHTEGLTFQQGSALRMIELLDFFVDYGIRHLAFLVASETNIEAFGNPDSNPYTKAELNYLTQYEGAFMRTIELLNNDPKKLIDSIEKTPEILMAEANVNEIPALSGGAGDPLRLGFIPGISHIFHWVGIRIVNWEVERYERAKKEKRDIEMRLEALRQKRMGNVDARIEDQIVGYERELTLTRAKIASYEEKMR